MKEQIKEVFEGMTVGDLKELRTNFKVLQKDVENDLKRNLLDSELKDKKAIVDASLPLFLSLGGCQVIEIIEEIERERKEKWGWG